MYLTRNYQSNKYTCISIVVAKYNWKYRAENRGRKNTDLSGQLTEEAANIISPLSLGKKTLAITTLNQGRTAFHFMQTYQGFLFLETNHLILERADL